MTTRGGGLAVGAVIVAVGLAIAQALGYLLNVVGARWLGPDSFGAFASLLSVLIIGSVIGGGIQVVGARRIALASGDRAGISRDVLMLATWSAAVVCLVSLALSPFLTALLHLDGWMSAGLTAVALVPVTVAGAQYALPQGREDYPRLAVSYALVGAGKAVGGIVGAVALGTLTGAMLGLVVGSYVALALGLLLVRPLASAPRSRTRDLVRESLHATHTLGALFVLTNIDVILARVLLDAEDAGLYAVGSILTKIAFWLPQFVGVVAFTRMTGHRRSRATWIAVGTVSAIGVMVIAVTAGAAVPIVRIIGGAAYEPVAGSLWLFALAGSLFAIGQALLLSRIAQDDRRSVIAVWAAAVILLALALAFAHSVFALVACACAGGLALCSIGVLIALRARPTRLQ